MINEYLLNSNIEYSSDLAGNKVINLLPYKLFTPEFIVLSTKFYSGWVADKENFIKSQISTISTIAIYFQQKDYDTIILRSSCTKENIVDRGKYHSDYCKPNVEEIRRVLNDIYLDFEAQKEDPEISIAVIVQVYKKAKNRGHLSNERRVNPSKFYWLLEEESSTDAPNRSTPFTVSDIKPTFDFSLSNCLNYNTLINNIKKLSAWFSQFSEYFHIEWLWDGKTFWLLQIDKEKQYSYIGTKPGSDCKLNTTKNDYRLIDDLEVLETVLTTTNHWRKIECVKVFASCGLPYWPIYILENESILEDISKGVIDVSLVTD